MVSSPLGGNPTMMVFSKVPLGNAPFGNVLKGIENSGRKKP